MKNWINKKKHEELGVVKKKSLKILIVRFSSIGDIVLTTPVVRCLRKKFPDATLHYLTKKQFAGILTSNPYIDKVVVLEKSIKETLTILKKEEYDEVIDLHHNLRTIRIKWGLKNVSFHSFPKLNVEKWWFTNFKINRMPSTHIVDRYLKTVSHLGVVNDELGLDYFVPEKELVKDEDIPFSHIHGYIAIVIGAAHATKRLPIQKLQQLAKEIEYPIMLMGGKDDVENGEIIAATDTVKIYNACGKFSLNESADLVRRAKLVISHDTGMMHIAAAFKKTILSIWGNTVPSFGMVPYKTNYEVFEVNHLACRPCSKTGFKECPLGHFKCMQHQSVDAIVQMTQSKIRLFSK